MYGKVLMISAFFILCLAIRSGSAVDDLPGFQAEALKRHNFYRAKHGCPDLELDEDLKTAALTRSVALSKAPAEPFPVNTEGHGENTFSITDLTLSINAELAVSIVDGWYKQIDGYDVSKPETLEASAQFTQVICKDTQKLGCGCTLAPGAAPGTDPNNIFCVCNYTPEGNIDGKFKDNVPPLANSGRKSDCTSAIFPIILLTVFFTLKAIF